MATENSGLFHGGLENQKLTEEGSDFVTATTLTIFVSLRLLKEPLPKRYPTLFRWYSEKNHRTYYLFATLDIKMARHQYTVEELMAVRGAQVPMPARMLVLANNPELADVVRDSSSESSSGYKPAIGKHRDDSSTTSDEVLFKGNISRRALRDSTRGSTNESNRFAMREPLRQIVPQPARELTRGPFREVAPAAAPTAAPAVAPGTALAVIPGPAPAVAPGPVPGPVPDHAPGPAPGPAFGAGPSANPNATRETDQQRPMEWRYHGRSDSESHIPEPIQAPTGNMAQKSEGFRRFYKAVVSPTHVRVTAGGRIVPNTRGPPSPTNKRAIDQPAIENMSLTDKAAQGKLPTHQLPVGSMGQPIPVVPQFLPGYPPGFQPIQAPLSFVPMAFSPHMPQGYQFAQPPNVPTALAPLPSGSTLTPKETTDLKAPDLQGDSRLPGEKQDKPKISPPEYFDYSKPYFYNGQIVYPVSSMSPSLGNAMGSSMMPVQMLGVPQGVPPQVQAPMMHHALQHGGNQMMAGSSFPQPSHRPQQMHGGAHPIVPVNSNFAAPDMAPPISSIRPSEITRKQITNFKQSLKYHEDQLQFNRHQIDEKEMEMKAQQYRDHIAAFEMLLKQQLEFEAEFMDKIKQKSDGSVTGEPGVQQNQHESEDSIRRRVAGGRQGINTNIGEGGKATFQRPIATNQSYGEPSRRAGIPSEAVLAPAFEPSGSKSTHEAAAESSKRLQPEGLWQYGPDIQTVASRSVTRSFNPSLSQQSEHAEESTSIASISGQSGSIDSSGPTRSAKGKGIASGYLRSKFGVPYLLGTLPKGLDPRKATDNDYIYTRPLNEAEQRARFLYWGKAPESILKGLPKYDGKHFYPASPVQEPSSPVAAHRNPTARPETEHAYRQTKSDQDPFRPMTPVHGSISKPAVASEDGYAMGRLTRNVSFETQVDSSGLEDLHISDSVGLPETGRILQNRGNSADAVSIGSIDRRSERSGYDPVPCPYPPHGYLPGPSMPDPYGHFFLAPGFRSYARTNPLMQRETLANRLEEGSHDQRDFVNDGTGSSASLFGTRSGFPKPFYY
ncbi:hypothetical protein QBC40DRAFT_312055 [Triangularia verruculosa]|uniref:Uncharacterized protein n=1 Tax=Triangularia verruculosa TaxID=2587418 RepID=A0AAN6XSG4_9PEZI|nr:hypothetical protein QBC40DRAFT_312055 [Triangularia verruculosa]